MNERQSVAVLHVPGPRCDARSDGSAQAAGVLAHVHALRAAGAPAPDLVVVSGNLTDSASPSGMEQALRFLTELRDELTADVRRLILVPGRGDVSRSRCEAHFALCRDEEIEPREPYYPKLERYAQIHQELYGESGVRFHEFEPWGFLEFDDLDVAVAAMNSTWSMTHRPEDDGGTLGQRQLAAMSRAMGEPSRQGMLRLGVVNHAPVHRGTRLRLHHGMLHDTARFEEQLAPHLHLLLHAPGETAREPGGPLTVLDGGLLAAAHSAVPELIEVTATELVDWSLPAAPLRRTAHGWTGLDAVFGTGPAAPAAPPADLPAPASGPARAVDPHQILLDRVEAVCQVRFAGARIDRIDVEPPFLRITEIQHGIVTQTQVGVVPGAPSRADLTAFLGAAYPGASGFDSFLVCDAETPIAPELHDEARRRAVRLQSFIEFQGLRGLFDLSRYVRRQNETLAASRQYPPDLYVPQLFQDLDRLQGPRDGVLLDELLRLADDPHGRFVLLLGDFGTGKTFALRELAQRIPERFPHLVPLYIELGRQDRPNTVPALVASHLANHGEQQIDLRAFNYLLEQGRVVLLFDGFDELAARLTYDTAADHLAQLLQAVTGKAKIFVTSRTQHFRSNRQVLTALGERIESMPQHRILSLRRFNHDQIRSYLVNHYGGDGARAAERLDLLGRIANFEDLAMNPRMLSFIATLDAAQLRRAAESRVVFSPADLYREILHSWLRFEAEVRPGASGLTVAELEQAVTAFAVAMWTERAAALPLTRLAEVAHSLTSVNARSLSTDQRIHAVGSGSLLIRVNDGGQGDAEELFTFIHASVMEWLVAAEIARELAAPDADPVLLAERKLTDLARNFLCDMADTAACQRWTARVQERVDPAEEVAHYNARRIAAVLNTPYHSNMRGANLRGEDLTERHWPGVDLTGADLTDALLSRVDFSGANLSGANLTGARIEHAKLNRTDLTGTRFDRARLLDVDLTGAVWDASTWSRSAAVDVKAAPALVDHIVAAGGASSERHLVRPELYPASVGVQTGFNARIGRLPASVAYHPSGSLLAIGGDGGILLCDTESGHPIRTLTGHGDRVYAVAFDDTGRRLASGSADGTVRIWDLIGGVTVGVLGSHRQWVWPMKFRPGSTHLATSDADGRLRLWDSMSGALLWEHDTHGDVAYSVAFTPDGETMAVGYRSGTVRLFAATTGTPLAQREIGRAPVYRVAYAPSGDGLVVAGGDSTLQLWDSAAARMLTRFEGPSGRVYSIAFHPSLPLLACGDTDGLVHVFDLRTGTLAYPPLRHGAHLYWVAFAPDGRLLATGDRSGTVQLWEAGTGTVHKTLDAHTGSVWPFEFRPDSAQLAVSDDQNVTRLWNSGSGQVEHTIAGHARQVTSVGFDKDGRLLATRCSDGLVRVWDNAVGEPVDAELGPGSGLTSYADAVMHPVDPVIATVNNEHRVSLRNLLTGGYERHFGFDREIWALAFSPSGKVIATANDDDTVQLWRRSTGQRLHVLGQHRGRVRDIAYSPDGSLLATGCDDTIVRVWDADTGELRRTLAGHTKRVYALAFSPDGELLVSTSLDGTARVWDADGQLVRTFTEHTGRLWAAAFHPGGLVATAGDDLAIRIWDPRTGEVAHTLKGHEGSIWTLAFTPDGTRLASGGDDGTTRLWHIGERSRLDLVLVGLPEGWAAMTGDGQYKVEGRVNGHLWFVLGASRFELGQLDEFLPQIRRLPLGTRFTFPEEDPGPR